MSRLKIKVCGMREAQNIGELAALQPDYMGFIFYEKSPRFALCNPNFSLLPVFAWQAGSTIGAQRNTNKSVAVFVNEEEAKMRKTANMYGIKILQLHGSETPEQCSRLRKDFTVIKAISVAESKDFEVVKEYRNCCDFFLFDTKAPQHGGSGAKFDWQLLENYQGATPFFLSGGIDLSDVAAITQLSHPQLYAVDINSRFELAAGMKDVEKIRQLMAMLKK